MSKVALLVAALMMGGGYAVYGQDEADDAAVIEALDNLGIEELSADLRYRAGVYAAAADVWMNWAWLAVSIGEKDLADTAIDMSYALRQMSVFLTETEATLASRFDEYYFARMLYTMKLSEIGERKREEAATE